jgi:hypothetical protein
MSKAKCGEGGPGFSLRYNPGYVVGAATTHFTVIARLDRAIQ